MIFNFKTSFSNIELLGFHKVRSGANELHNFHILKPSKWPLLVSFILFSLVLSFVIYMNCDSYSCESVHAVTGTSINTIQNTNTIVEDDHNNYYFYCGLGILLGISVITSIGYFIYCGESLDVTVELPTQITVPTTISESISSYLQNLTSTLPRFFNSSQEEAGFLYDYIARSVFEDPTIQPVVISDTFNIINEFQANANINNIFTEYFNTFDSTSILTVLELFALKASQGFEPSTVCGAGFYYFINFSIYFCKSGEFLTLNDSIKHLTFNLIKIAMSLSAEDPCALNSLINHGFHLQDDTYEILHKGSLEFLSVLRDGTVYIANHSNRPIVIEMADSINKYRHFIFALAFNKFLTLLFLSYT